MLNLAFRRIDMTNSWMRNCMAIAAAGTAAILPVASAVAADANPFDPILNISTDVAALSVALVRVIAFIAIAYAAIRIFFKKPDWYGLASIVIGLALMFLAPKIVDYIWTETGGINTQQIRGTSTIPGLSGGNGGGGG